MDDITDIELDSYIPSQDTKKLLKDTPILLLVGPTGSGKDTLAQELLKTGNYYAVVTNTTRPPRKNHGIDEVSGVEYYFIDNTKAKEMLLKQEFIEAALIHGNLYGTSVGELKKAIALQKIALTDLDFQGVRNYKKLSNRAMAVFLLPPSFDIMLERLARRYGHARHDEDIKNRIKTALSELNELSNQKYYYALINDDLQLTAEKTHHYVMTGKMDQDQNRQARQLAKAMTAQIKQYLAKQE